MTEKKRFTMYQNTIYDDGHIINAFECMKLLNWFDRKNDELIEENEQLKSEINMLKTTIGRNEGYIDRLTHKGEWR